MALVALAGASLAGCSSDGGRFAEGPFYNPSTQNQQSIFGGPYRSQQQQQQPAYAPPPEQTGSIHPGYSSAPLPPAPVYSQQAYPPPAPVAQYQPPVYQQPTYQPPVYQPPAYQPPVYQPPRVATTAPVYQPAPVPSQPLLRPAKVAPVPAPGPRVAAVPPQPLPAGPRAKVPAPLITGSTTQRPVVASAPVTPPAPIVPQPAPATSTQPSGWSNVGGTYVALKQGETIPILSQRYGVPINAIMAANNFADASKVQPGQQVLIPTYVYNNTAKPAASLQPQAQPAPMPAKIVPAPVPAKMSQAPVTAPVVKGGEHIVRKGETIDTIAKTYNIPKDKLKVANNLKGDRVELKPGQKLVLPSIPGQHIAQAPVVPAPTPAPGKAVAPIATTQTALATPVKPLDTKPAANEPKPAIAAIAQEPKPEAESPRREVKTAAPSFRWPVRGRVIADFGTKPGGDRNDGINLAVPEGTSVKSAEDGEVVYSGNELKGYGNVVLVKHSDGWVTVYAHTSDLLVNKGDKVTRGQIIARAGTTGSVNQPQLHFELRKGQKPVDPKGYLSN